MQRYGMNSLFGFKGKEVSAVNQADFGYNSSWQHSLLQIVLLLEGYGFNSSSF